WEAAWPGERVQPLAELLADLEASFEEQVRDAVRPPCPALDDTSAEEILAAIDDTLREAPPRAEPMLCPCGAPARPGSRYCSPDCEPTHIAWDTGWDPSAARWRPDMPLEDWDDLDLEQVDSWPHDD